MSFEFLNKEEYKEIKLLKMSDNRHGDLPFYLRRYKPGKNGELHRHLYMQINYVYQGKVKHIINNSEFDVIKGDIFVIPPYIPHCIKSDDSDGEIFEFEFVPEFINQSFENIENIKSFFDFAYIEPFLVSESQVKPRLNLAGRVQVEVENILNEALREYKEKKPGYPLLIKSLALKLLVLVGREFSDDLKSAGGHTIYDRHRDAIFNAIQYIDSHYAEDITVEDAARVCMLSQSYFSYLFKNITMKTFIEYLNGLRISKAMEYLRNSNDRVLDICYKVGFNNVNHFNRLFRQVTNLSPLQYRKSFQNAEKQA